MSHLFVALFFAPPRIWATRYRRSNDAEVVGYIFLMIAYGLWARLLNEQNFTRDTVVVAIQHVAISLAASLVSYFLVRKVRSILTIPGNSTHLLRIHATAPRTALWIFGVTFAAHLVPSLLFNYERIFFFIYAVISSTIAAVSTFYYLRNATLLVYGTSGVINPTDVENSSLEQILSLKRTIISSLFWVLGFSMVGFMLAIDKLDIIVGQTGVRALLWYSSGLGILFYSSFGLIALRMVDEYEFIRHYRIDESSLLFTLEEQLTNEESRGSDPE